MAERLVVTSVQADQAAGFAVFARTRTQADAMPDDVAEQVGNSTRSGRNVALSRAVRTPYGRGWVVPGNEHVCLVMPDPVDGYGITCSDTAHALTHGLIGLLISSDSPNVAAVTMVLPRNSTAHVAFKDGRTETLFVDGDGVVSTTVMGARSLSVETGSGDARTALPVPR
jgi:hypothetical protein